MYLAKIPRPVQRLFPQFTWRVNDDSKSIFITFDDGPIPEITPWVLDQLDVFDAKATFFCVGDNVRKHPDIYREVLDRGHSVGNHTYHHLDGWSSDTGEYVNDVAACDEMIESQMFRPPYGKFPLRNAKSITEQYEVVMWDVLSCDFDKRLTGRECYDNVVRNADSGSIVVFHDSQKAWPRLQYALPKTLDYFSLKGFTFDALQQKTQTKLEKLKPCFA